MRRNEPVEGELQGLLFSVHVKWKHDTAPGTHFSKHSDYLNLVLDTVMHLCGTFTHKLLLLLSSASSSTPCHLVMTNKDTVRPSTATLRCKRQQSLVCPKSFSSTECVLLELSRLKVTNELNLLVQRLHNHLLEESQET